MHPFLTIADRAARAAGQRIIRALERLDRLKIYEKSTNHFVTEIDYESEAIIIKHIQEVYPHHSILSEESGYLAGDEEYVWVIDPIDGTSNFMHGCPGFAISIAVQYRGKLDQALIYDPFAQETFYASRGQGARLYQNRLRVSKRSNIKNALIYMHRPASEQVQLQQWSNILQSLLVEKASIRNLGSTALGLAYVAAGRLDAFFAPSTLPLWDKAAGALLVEEAGGIICDPYSGQQILEAKGLLAANTKLTEDLLKLTRSKT